MPRCSCAGSSCSCLIVDGTGTAVTGTGTIADPYRIAIDPATIDFSAAVKVSSSNSLTLSVEGNGSLAQPLLISGEVKLFSPNGTPYALAVADDGTLTAVETTL